jgi:hypothetical protein
MDLNFLRLIVEETGPKTYLDFRSCFLRIRRALL